MRQGLSMPVLLAGRRSRATTLRMNLATLYKGPLLYCRMRSTACTGWIRSPAEMSRRSSPSSAIARRARKKLREKCGESH